MKIGVRGVKPRTPRDSLDPSAATGDHLIPVFSMPTRFPAANIIDDSQIQGNKRCATQRKDQKK